MPASMASARLEKLEAGQADMRTNQMNLIDLSTQRPPHPRAVAGWTFVSHSLPGNARPAARDGVLTDNLNALPIVGVDARCQSIPGQGHVSLDTSLYGRGYNRTRNGPLMERGEGQMGNVA